MPPEEDPNQKPTDPEPKPDAGGDPPDEKPGGSNPVDQSKYQEALRERAKAKDRAAQAEAKYQSLLEANDGEPVTAEDIKAFREAKKEKEAAETEAAKRRGDFEKLLEKERADHKKALGTKDSRYEKLFGDYSNEKLGLLAAKLVADKVTEGAVDFATNALIHGDAKQGVRMEFAQAVADGPYEPRLVDSVGNPAVDSETGDLLSFEKYRDRFFLNHPYLARPDARPGPGPSGDSGEPVGKTEDIRKKMRDAVDSGDQAAYRKYREQLFEMEPAKNV